MAGFIAFPTILYASQEDKIKAAYLYQLTYFTEWPKSTLSRDTLSICILGKDKIGKELAPLHMRQSGGVHIEIVYIERPIDASSCNILYIANTEKKHLSLIFDVLQVESVLTVSSIKDFVKQGGIIGFAIINNTVRLEVNYSAALKAGITLSAKLLEVASLVVNDKVEVKHL
ncbi:MAG: YfiR family protein [Pseudomonadales bacterium]|nr:YfiR family protein [Pseudomonadales bacterium]